MALEKFTELDSVAGDANILNKTRFILQEGRKKLSDRDKTILELAIDFLDRLLSGYRFDTENIYVSNLLDSVNTYDSSRPALKRLNVGNFAELIENSKSIIKGILESGSFKQIEIDKMTIDLFKEIGSYLLHVGLKIKREDYFKSK